MIEVRNITKRFGSVLAVDDLSFDVQSGRVTGFLGPNGSGKSTTMRCMLGLDRAQSGSASFDGKAFASLDEPLRQVGALLDAGYVHPSRTGRNHLRWMAASNGLPDSRVDEALELVGLTDAAKRRVKGYSLGMKQRLGLAGVMLGDPHTIVLDEPANGLDPEGIRWIRDVLRHLASEGRAVLVSSHLLSEMALMANDLVVIGQGRLVEQGTVEEFVDRHSETSVRVRSPQLSQLVDVARADGAVVALVDPTDPAAGASVSGLAVERVGELAAANAVVLHELAVVRDSLEDAFLRATAGVQEYRSGPDAGGPPTASASSPPSSPLSSPPPAPPRPPTDLPRPDVDGGAS